MMHDSILIAALLGAIGGGALGAWLARATIWKGAAVTAAASLAHLVIVELAGVERFLVEIVIYVVVVGLVGGRWGLGLSARQLSIIVIGSFLFAIGAGVAAALLIPASDGS